MRLCAYPYRKQGKNHPKLDLIREENDLQDRFLHMMYSHAAGRAAMQPLVQSFVSRAAGCFLGSRLSVPLVAPFVKKNHISLKECTAKQFISFNDFFVRKLKMDARPFSNAPQDFISPCDARLTVYPIHENGKFEIKNTEYTLEQLLRDRKLAKRYEGGTLFLFRLSVDDYHRYLFVDDGVCSTEHRFWLRPQSWQSGLHREERQWNYASRKKQMRFTATWVSLPLVVQKLSFCC